MIGSDGRGLSAMTDIGTRWGTTEMAMGWRLARVSSRRGAHDLVFS